jgi:Tfp pilus assembly protein PilF
MPATRLPLPHFGNPSPRFIRSGLVLLLAAGLASAAARADCKGPEELESAVQTHPSVDAWAELGNWFGQQGNFACAASAFQAAVRLQPDSAQLSYLLGLAYFEAEDLHSAVPALQNSIHNDGTALRPHLLLATIDMRLGNLKDASPEWSEALALDPANAMALHGLSRCHVALGDFSSELDLLHNATLDADLSVDLGTAYMGLGRYDDVIDTLSGVVKTLPAADPQSALAHALLAWALLMEGQPADALPEAQAAVGAAATLPLAQISLGRALVDTGDAPAAVPVLEAALKVDAKNLETHLQLARAYAETGRGPDARRERLVCLQMMAAPVRPTTVTGPHQEAAPAH